MCVQLQIGLPDRFAGVDREQEKELTRCDERQARACVRRLFEWWSLRRVQVSSRFAFLSSIHSNKCPSSLHYQQGGEKREGLESNREREIS
jgi:hypothetical protein